MILDPTAAPRVPRPTHVEIDLDQLTANYRAVERAVTPAGMLPVVKAGAYGHGLVEVARLFENCGPTGLAVAFLEEGAKLREAGSVCPILVMGGLDIPQIPDFLHYGLTMTVSSIQAVGAIEEAADRLGTVARVHAKVDTGMGRMGVRPEGAPELLDALHRSPHVDVEAVYSHFATADEPDPAQTVDQMATFRRVVSCFGDRGLPTPTLHLANSGAVLQHPGSYLDLVRPGLMLYGVYPTDTIPRTVGTEPALTWRSTVVLSKPLPSGSPVSYGATWTPDRDTRIVVVPMGYGDGYPRLLSNRGEVLIRGRRHPVVGRVCMDQFMVDAGPDTDVRVGDEVVIIGAQGDERITANELAAWAETIPYEILTGISSRVPRRYRGGAQQNDLTVRAPPEWQYGHLP
ncbi:MAG: alanine racemase [bacterium]|nr:alanine racemase [bacterium]MDE0352123.1 alanine racemase [bacterium]